MRWARASNQLCSAQRPIPCLREALKSLLLRALRDFGFLRGFRVILPCSLSCRQSTPTVTASAGAGRGSMIPHPCAAARRSLTAGRPAYVPSLILAGVAAQHHLSPWRGSHDAASVGGTTRISHWICGKSLTRRADALRPPRRRGEEGHADAHQHENCRCHG